MSSFNDSGSTDASDSTPVRTTEERDATVRACRSRRRLGGRQRKKSRPGVTELYLGPRDDFDDEMSRLLEAIDEPIEELTVAWENEGLSKEHIDATTQVLSDEAVSRMASTVLGPLLKRLAWSAGEAFGLQFTNLAIRMATDDPIRVRSHYKELLEKHEAQLDMMFKEDTRLNSSRFLETLLVHLSDLDHNRVNPLSGLKLHKWSDISDQVRPCCFTTEEIRELENEPIVEHRVPAVRALVSTFAPNNIALGHNRPFSLSSSNRVIYVSKTAPSLRSQ